MESYLLATAGVGQKANRPDIGLKIRRKTIKNAFCNVNSHLCLSLLHVLQANEVFPPTGKSELFATIFFEKSTNCFRIFIKKKIVIYKLFIKFFLNIKSVFFTSMAGKFRRAFPTEKILGVVSPASGPTVPRPYATDIFLFLKYQKLALQGRPYKRGYTVIVSNCLTPHSMAQFELRVQLCVVGRACMLSVGACGTHINHLPCDYPFPLQTPDRSPSFIRNSFGIGLVC